MDIAIQHGAMFLWLVLFMDLNLSVFPQRMYTHIPDIVSELCPYSDICDKKASMQLSDPGQLPCCTPCFCDDKCGIRLDCCFNYQDKYNLVENAKAACVDPDFKNNGIDDKNYKQGYLMIKACGINEFLEINDSYVNRCVNENGTLIIAPVSSLDTKLIYVNELCAVCNGVDTARLRRWNYFVEHGKISKSHDDFEGRIYVPPEDEDWSNKICYKKFRLDETFCTLNSEWYQICHTLYAPYRSLNTFRNVFCLLCSGIPKAWISRNKCTSNNLLPKTTWNQMVYLLDSSVLDDSETLQGYDGVEMYRRKHIAVNGLTLIVNCPKDMISTQSGCKYFVLKWFNGVIQLLINLTAVKETVLPVSDWQNEHFRLLKLPCGDDTRKFDYDIRDQTIEYLIEDNNKTSYISSIVIEVKESMPEEGVDPSVIVPFYKNCLSEQWEVIVDNCRYMLKPSLAKYGGQKAQPFIAWDTSAINKPTLRLKKPFFCENVHIPISEVEVFIDEIRIRSGNATIGSNEFIVNPPNLYGNTYMPFWNTTTYSVCIEDIERTKIVSSNSNDYFSLLYIISCIALYHVLLISA